MFSLSNFSAGLPFPANAWLRLQAAQVLGQACTQLNPSQWGMQPPNNNPTWGGATTNIHFWGSQGLPHMAQSPAQQVPNQTLNILAYTAHTTLPQPHLYMPGQPGAVHPPEQDNLTSSLAQLHIQSSRNKRKQFSAWHSSRQRSRHNSRKLPWP